MLFAAESGIPIDMQVVDLFTGEHDNPSLETINPNHLVPVLEEGGFRLTESAAILEYLADEAGSPLYPKDLQGRARVNERMQLDQHPAVPGPWSAAWSTRSRRAAPARPREVAEAMEFGLRGHQRLRRHAEGPTDADRMIFRRDAGVPP